MIITSPTLLGAIALWCFAGILWLSADFIGRAFVPDDSGNRLNEIAVSMLFRLPPGMQSSADIAFNVRLSAVFFFLSGCLLFAVNVGWIKSANHRF